MNGRHRCPRSYIYAVVETGKFCRLVVYESHDMEFPRVILVAIPAEQCTDLLACGRMRYAHGDIENIVYYSPSSDVHHLASVNVAQAAGSQNAVVVGIVCHEGSRSLGVPVAGIQAWSAEEHYAVKDAAGAQSLTVFQYRIFIYRRCYVGDDARFRVIAVYARRTYVGILAVLIAVGIGFLGISRLSVFACPALVFVWHIVAHARLHETAIALHAEIVVVGRPVELVFVCTHSPCVGAVALADSAIALQLLNLLQRQSGGNVFVLLVCQTVIGLVNRCLVDGVNGQSVVIVHIRTHTVFYLEYIERIHLLHIFEHFCQVSSGNP
ncbi:unknown [Prevotella sp. CAG:592]|nr:unknown [Prevotella sp. CAG:592]